MILKQDIELAIVVQRDLTYNKERHYKPYISG